MGTDLIVDKKITLDDCDTFLVIEQVELDNHTYIYIVNSTDENDAKFMEINEGNLDLIDPKLFAEKILPLFLEKFNSENVS